MTYGDDPEPARHAALRQNVSAPTCCHCCGASLRRTGCASWRTETCCEWKRPMRARSHRVAGAGGEPRAQEGCASSCTVWSRARHAALRHTPDDLWTAWPPRVARRRHPVAHAHEQLRGTQIPPLNIDTIGRGAGERGRRAGRGAAGRDPDRPRRDTTNSILSRSQPAIRDHPPGGRGARPPATAVFIEVLIAEVRRNQQLRSRITGSAAQAKNGQQQHRDLGRADLRGPAGLPRASHARWERERGPRASALATRGNVRHPLAAADHGREHLEARITVVASVHS